METNNIKKAASILTLSLLLLVTLVFTSFAGQPPKAPAASKEVAGRVSGISKNYIAIAYGSDEATHTEYEMLIPLDKSLNLTHVKTLDQIKVGDTVSIQFDETVETTIEGEKVFRRGKGIAFISAAPKVVESDVLGAEKQ